LNYITNITQSAGAFIEPLRFVQKEFCSPSICVSTLVGLGVVLAAGATWKYRTAILHCAARRGHLYVIKLLQKIGTDLEKDDRYGAKPLHLAARNGHRNVCEFLLDCGADIEKRTYSYSRTPLHLATKNGHYDVVAFLLDRGADINASAMFGVMPLHLAVENNDNKLINFLLDRGADIEASGSNWGGTPLHDAAIYGHVAATETLLASGANIRAKNDKGQTPFHVVRNNDSCSKIIDLFIKKITFPYTLREKQLREKNPALPPFNLSNILFREFFNSQRDNKGRTPLHSFVENGNFSGVEKLLKMGVSLSLSNSCYGAASLRSSREYPWVYPWDHSVTPLDVALDIYDNNNIRELFKVHTKYLRLRNEEGETPVQLNDRHSLYSREKYKAMKFFIKIEGKTPGTLYDSDRKLCIRYVLETSTYVLETPREVLLKILNPSEAEIASYWGLE